MRSLSRTALYVSLFALASAGALLLIAADANDVKASAPPPRSAPQKAPELGDHELAPFRAELLELAFQTATKLPLQPHIKNRARAQDLVVAASLELDQSKRALGYIEQIPNWRRAAAYADLALHSAQAGRADAAEFYVELALQTSRAMTDDNSQDWHVERVHAKVATTQLLLGRADEATKLASSLSSAEAGPVQGARASLVSDDAFEEELKTFDHVIATGDFEGVHAVLGACAELFDRFYEQPERRAAAEKKIVDSWGKLPFQIRVELLVRMTNAALDHADRAKARELIDQARAFVDGQTWQPEARIGSIARLAGLRHRAGDTERARSEADEALTAFETARDEIVDIYRAEALRPIAEAYATMGDVGAAVAVYRRAVDEGSVNPNSRPRVDDLTATCCSMALHAVEPDAELWARMRQIFAGLGEPW